MPRQVVSVVTGFTKNEVLCRRGFAPLRDLKRRGLIQRILYVTWDSPGLDRFVAPAAEMPEVETVRVPAPDFAGTPYQKGVVYQLRNLEAALALIPDKYAVVLKTRPDFVADRDFLADKITNFDSLCRASTLPRTFGVNCAPSPFKAKIWLPWADSNQPFFFEDAAFMGLKRDVAKLADRGAEARLDVLRDTSLGWFAHVIRFAMPFIAAYPMFERYIREFHYFPNNLEFRKHLLPAMIEDPFFWHLILANAWILATSFHVDCGQPGQLSLYTNISNQQADWTKVDSLQNNSPYDDVQGWRDGQSPGGVLPGAVRAYGRLMDDSWAHALFTRPGLTDLTQENIRGVLNNLTLYRQGFLTEIEDQFYSRLAGLCRTYKPGSAA